MLWKDDVNIILTPKHKYGAYHYDTAPYSQLSYLSYSPLQSKSTDTSTCSPKEAETPYFTLHLTLHHSFFHKILHLSNLLYTFAKGVRPYSKNGKKQSLWKQKYEKKNFFMPVNSNKKMSQQ